MNRPGICFDLRGVSDLRTNNGRTYIWTEWGKRSVVEMQPIYLSIHSIFPRSLRMKTSFAFFLYSLAISRFDILLVAIEERKYEGGKIFINPQEYRIRPNNIGKSYSIQGLLLLSLDWLSFLSIYLCIYLSCYQYFFLSTHVYIYLFIYLPIYLFTYPFYLLNC